jgi:hypothetical protein
MFFMLFVLMSGKCGGCHSKVNGKFFCTTLISYSVVSAVQMAVQIVLSVCFLNKGLHDSTPLQGEPFCD